MCFVGYVSGMPVIIKYVLKNLLDLELLRYFVMSLHGEQINPSDVWLTVHRNSVWISDVWLTVHRNSVWISDVWLTVHRNSVWIRKTN